MPRKSIVLFLSVCMMLCACSKVRYKYGMNVSTILADKGTIRMSIEFEFDSKEEMEAFKNQSGKIKYAISLMLGGYSTQEVTNKGVTNNTIQKLISDRFKLSYHRVIINEFTIKDEKGEKVVQETVFTPKK